MRATHRDARLPEAFHDGGYPDAVWGVRGVTTEAILQATSLREEEATLEERVLTSLALYLWVVFIRWGMRRVWGDGFTESL
jgi:hypothetical protein